VSGENLLPATSFQSPAANRWKLATDEPQRHKEHKEFCRGTPCKCQHSVRLSHGFMFAISMASNVQLELSHPVWQSESSYRLLL